MVVAMAEGVLPFDGCSPVEIQRTSLDTRMEALCIPHDGTRLGVSEAVRPSSHRSLRSLAVIVVTEVMGLKTPVKPGLIAD